MRSSERLQTEPRKQITSTSLSPNAAAVTFLSQTTTRVNTQLRRNQGTIRAVRVGRFPYYFREKRHPILGIHPDSMSRTVVERRRLSPTILVKRGHIFGDISLARPPFNLVIHVLPSCRNRL
jgi:hypothetical protein